MAMTHGKLAFCTIFLSLIAYISRNLTSPFPTAAISHVISQSSQRNYKIAFVSKIVNQYAITVTDLNGISSQQLATMPSPIDELRWSPDGKTVAFVLQPENECGHLYLL